MLVRNFAIKRSVQHRVAPRWDLMIVLRRLMRPPFEPMNMASLADMTRKLAFLLTLASAKRNSESGWIRQLIKQAYSEVQDEDIPHLTHTNFQAIGAQSICLFLGVPPKLFLETGHGSGLIEKQQYVCFNLPKRPLPNGGCDYDGPLRG